MVPPVIHFIWLSGIPFSFVHFIAVKSAYLVNEGYRVQLHCEVEPPGPWWRAAREYAEPVPLAAPTQIGGRPLLHPAHRADVARLRILKEYGGIYLDLDTVCVRPFAPLRGNRFVLGEEGDGEGLSNAVILSEPGHPFLDRWLAGFDPKTSYWHGFRSRGPQDEYWAEISVDYPMFLVGKFPDEVTVVTDEKFLWPRYNDDDLERFFRGHFSSPNSMCHHLWQRVTWDYYLRAVTPEYVRSVDSTYNLIARRVLDG